MKNVLKTFAIIALVAIIGFSFAALSLTGCDTGGGGGGDTLASQINGTWKADDGESITLNNGNFVISENDKQNMKGTYTATARSISANLKMDIKEIHGDYLNESDVPITFESKWYNQTQFTDAYKKEDPSISDKTLADLNAVIFKTMNGTVDGDTMIVDNTTFTKNGGSTDPGTGGGSGKWTAANVSSIFGTSAIQVITYANNKFFAGASNGKIATSPDGVTWTVVANTPFGTNTVWIIAYGDSTLVVGISGSKTSRSTDGGVTWSDPTSNIFTGQGYASASINGIAYGNSKFVAVGSYGQIAYSSDNGATWTKVSNSTFGTYDNTIYEIAFGGGKFVAVGSVGKMATSSDGITWEAVSDSKLGPGRYIDEIAYGNGRFVAGGYVDGTAYSTDGTNWTRTPNNVSINQLAFGNGRFVSAAVEHTEYSTDGAAWTRICGKSSAFDPDSAIFALAYGNGKWVAGDSDGKIAYLTGY